MPTKKWLRTHRARRKARRRGRKRTLSDEELVQYYLTTLLGPALLPKPPVDPYARGNVVPPMKTSHTVSYEAAHGMRGNQKPLWGHRAYNPDFGNMTGIVRTTVPIWSDRPQMYAPVGRLPGDDADAPHQRWRAEYRKL